MTATTTTQVVAALSVSSRYAATSNSNRCCAPASVSGRKLSGQVLGLNSRNVSHSNCLFNQPSKQTTVSRLCIPGKANQPKFDASKVEFRCTLSPPSPTRSVQSAASPRFYTLTHNDTTAIITLSVGSDWSAEEVWGDMHDLRGKFQHFFFRDQVLGEWRDDGLHLHCHIDSASTWWLTPMTPLRNFIFSMEFPGLLQTILYLEAEYLAEHPEKLTAPTQVHFYSTNPKYNRTEMWGPLDEATECQETIHHDPAIQRASPKSSTLARSSSFSVRCRQRTAEEVLTTVRDRWQ